MEQNHLCNFGRGQHAEHFCEINLNEFRSVAQEKMLFKDISIFSSGCHFVRQSRTVNAVLVEGIIRDISVHLFRIWASGY